MLLRTEDLTKDYGRYRALSDLRMGVAAGEIFGLLGPNGSGKSTALRLILGFLQPTAGRAFVADHDCWSDGVAARRHIAYLPGELRLYENMTGRELIRFLGQLRGLSNGAELPALAKRFDIDVDRPLSELSSGMKRKVALLQVLLARAPLLILDEPTNTLDPTMRDELLALLKEARSQGQAVLFSSHVLAEVESVCDRVGILQRGRLVHLQPMSQLASGRRIRARFGDSRAPAPSLPGLTLIAQHDGEAAFEYSGALQPLLESLAHWPIEDLRIEPLGLAAIYRRYHGAEE